MIPLEARRLYRRSVECCLLLPLVAEEIPAPIVQVSFETIQGRALNLQWPTGPGMDEAVVNRCVTGCVGG